MQKELVSIIVPSYNSGVFLTETLESCFSQSWLNIEVIVVDDGSTDNTLEILGSISDKRLKILSQENRGACAARNLGFTIAKGNYIQYLDADDVLSPTKIENQLKLLAKTPANAVASCSWMRFYNNIEDAKVETSDISKSYSNPLQWLIDSWNGKGMGQTSIWLTPTSLIEKAGPWNETLKINQDGEFFARVLLQAEEIIYSSDSIVFYRSSNPNSISKVFFSEEKAYSLLTSYVLYKNHIPEHVLNEEVKHALARNFSEIIYRFDGIYPEVSKRAILELSELNIKHFNFAGGKFFKIIARCLGFEQAIRLRTFLR